MPVMSSIYRLSRELVLGTRLDPRVPDADQRRQRMEVEEILRRLRGQPGVILADEVGMGKTFVALAIAYSVSVCSPRPVVVMIPPNLVDKWVQDLKTFCSLYLNERTPPVAHDQATRKQLADPKVVRFGVARHSLELMKLLDDPPGERCHLIFLAQGAMNRRQTDKWIRLALIAEALRRHGRGGASRLIKVKGQIHRFLAELLWAIGEERASDWGDELWQELLGAKSEDWKEIYNETVTKQHRKLTDDPVPKSVRKALRRINLKELARAMEGMPVKAVGGEEGVSKRLDSVRQALRWVEEDLWKKLLTQVHWRSPLLVMDEAHHLKNPGTSLARQLQSAGSAQDMRTGDGAMAQAFDRMLFLTATPFQLGHHELVSVLKRFGDVQWNVGEMGKPDGFHASLQSLGKNLDDSQRAAIALQLAWSRLRPEDCDQNGDTEGWWLGLRQSKRETLTHHQRAIVEAFEMAKRCRDAAEKALRPWIVRHDKGAHWVGTDIVRRKRLEGAGIAGETSSKGGLPIPPDQLLPFFLAARSAVRPGQDLLGEALSSSFEAFRFTRNRRDAGKDSEEDVPEIVPDLSHSGWYLREFDRALEHCSGAAHPKMHATVKLAVDLWEAGEKVLVFAFYRQTCRALRLHISEEIERRVLLSAQQRSGNSAAVANLEKVERLLKRIRERFFDKRMSKGRKSVDEALDKIIEVGSESLDVTVFDEKQREKLKDVMRRFLRVTTTLVRCFPLADFKSMAPADAVRMTLDHTDASGISWREKFRGFIEFLSKRCSTDERGLFLEAALHTQTGGIRVEDEEEEDVRGKKGRVTLANVQVATGVTHRDTRTRLMRAFNTPFFPDIFVCSQVMGEGVDLQRFCRHVIHHDLAWNPSTIEQRTGRIDRLGCKAEGRKPIVVYLPYLSGTADERQYRVMSEREQWFRVVMGQDEVAGLITADSDHGVPLPASISDELGFRLFI